MGFLGKMIKNGISEGIGSGIAQGISKAVSGAVEKTIAPAAEKLASAAATDINNTADAIDNANKENESNKAGLENAFTHLGNAVQGYVESAAAAGEDMNEFAQLLPGYPLWNMGGNFSIADKSETDDGRPFVYVNISGVPDSTLDGYADFLKANGFRQKYAGSDETLYMPVGGRYYIFNQTETYVDDNTFCFISANTASL